MMEMICLAAGPLHAALLDEQTYESNKERYAELPYPIPGYPSMDSDQRRQRADPV
jgi:hypothetical protein